MVHPLGQELGAGFEPVTDREWREAAKGSDPGTSLSTEVEPGLEAQWLYVPADALAPDPGGEPVEPPWVRGVRSGIPWEGMCEISTPERDSAREQVVEETSNDISTLQLRLDLAARRARRPGSTEFEAERGVDGIAISTLADIEQVLEPVNEIDVELAIEAGPGAIAAGALLAAYRRRHAPGPIAAAGSMRIDPLGALAAGETLLRPPQEEIAIAAALARAAGTELPSRQETPGTWPVRKVRAFGVATTPFVEAGATAAWELGVAIANGIEYLRACERAGLSVESAAGQIEFTLTVGPDQFLEIAKFRAFRRLWNRVLEVSGDFEAPEGRLSRVVAIGSARMMTSLDPWTNMLRGTTSAFAAALGGADAVLVNPFDRLYAGWEGREPDPEVADGGVGAAAGPGRLGRRIARNTNHILQLEARLGELVDPAGGSWYVESLTDELARQAWSHMQEIERQGGARQALVSGFIGERLGEFAGARRSELARRERLMTGVNIYPKLGGDRVRVETADRERLEASDSRRLIDVGEVQGADRLRAAVEAAVAGADGGGDDGPGTELLDALAAYAEAGASIDRIAEAIGGERFAIEPLDRARDAEPFESLRAAANEHVAAGGARPRVLLACLGPIARHVGVANWAKSFFEVAGIEVVNSVEVTGNGGLERLEEPAEAASPGPEDLGPALIAAGAPIAAVCAGRDEPAGALRDAVATLREAGAAHVYLATPTAEQAEGAGADEVVSDGVDMVEVLSEALRRCGVAFEWRGD